MLLRAAIAVNHRYNSIGIPSAILLNSLNILFLMAGNGFSLMLQVEILYLNAVSEGSEQTQVSFAFGTHLRMLCSSACKVQSFPKFPAPKIPKRAIFNRIGSAFIADTPQSIS